MNTFTLLKHKHNVVKVFVKVNLDFDTSTTKCIFLKLLSTEMLEIFLLNRNDPVVQEFIVTCDMFNVHFTNLLISNDWVWSGYSNMTSRKDIAKIFRGKK